MDNIKNESNSEIMTQVLYGPPTGNTRDGNVDEFTPKNNQEDANEVTVQALYGPPPANGNKNVLKGTNIGIVIVLFILGVFAILSKKISKTAKIVIVSCIVLFGIVITLIFNFLLNKMN